MMSTSGETSGRNPPRYAPRLVSWSLNPSESIFECAPKLDASRKQDRSVPVPVGGRGDLPVRPCQGPPQKNLSCMPQTCWPKGRSRSRFSFATVPCWTARAGWRRSARPGARSEMFWCIMVILPRFARLPMKPCTARLFGSVPSARRCKVRSSIYGLSRLMPIQVWNPVLKRIDVRAPGGRPGRLGRACSDCRERM